MRAVRTSIARLTQRMDAFEEKMDELLMLLRTSQSPPSAPGEDMLVSPCSTVTELEEFDRSLGQPERRIKMQLFLTKFRGPTTGTAVRRMLRRVATNNVLKECSLRGRKAKEDLPGPDYMQGYNSGLQEELPRADCSRRGGLDRASAEVCPTQTAS
ncbi:uncharacterized protein LOC144530362 [Sander vitreus]